MGGCFSSKAAGGEAAAECDVGAGGEGRRRARRRRLSDDDEDGRWPYAGERDVDDKAAVFIANFRGRLQAGAAAAAAAS
ncbi:hypothetical protein ACP4OV_009382 [Aristida adscensionis]